MKELTIDPLEPESPPATPTEEFLLLGKLALRMNSVERMPTLPNGRRENNAEHSFMLAQIIVPLAAKYEPDADLGLVARGCFVHDLVEAADGVGDTSTWGVSDEVIDQKYVREQSGMEQLVRIFDFVPELARTLEEYEAQRIKEFRLVRYADKLVPGVVNLHGGIAVLWEGHGAYDLAELERRHRVGQERFKDYAEEFPWLAEIKEELFHQVCEQFQAHAPRQHSNA